MYSEYCSFIGKKPFGKDNFTTELENSYSGNNAVKFYKRNQNLLFNLQEIALLLKLEYVNKYEDMDIEKLLNEEIEEDEDKDIEDDEDVIIKDDDDEDDEILKEVNKMRKINDYY